MKGIKWFGRTQRRKLILTKHGITKPYFYSRIDMANNTSQHILNTSATLLGFCLFVITSLHITNTAESSLIDEFTSIIALLLIFSSFFSFFSIQTKDITREQRLEKIANYLFIASLAGILLIVLLLIFKFIR